MLVGVMLNTRIPVAALVVLIAIVGLPPSDVRIGEADAGVSRTCIRAVQVERSTRVPEASLYVSVSWNVLPRSTVVL